MREVQTHLERTARLTVAMTAVCVEESEKREGWSLKGKSTPFLSALPASIRRAVPAGQHARRFGQARVPRELPRHLHLLSATPVGLFEGFKLG